MLGSNRFVRWGTLCGVFGMLLFVVGCPTVEPRTSCDDDDPCAEDGNFCNGVEECGDDGFCASPGTPCAEGESCDEDTDECYTACPEEGECDDGSVCTEDSCGDDDRCVFAAIDCDDDDECTDDACDATDGCVNTDTDCDDGDECTTDSCDPATGCANDDEDCDDGDLCTDDSCDPATGCANDDVVCDPGDVCNPETGECEPPPPACDTDADCDDGDVCTMDTCTGGECGSTDIAGCCNVDADCAVDETCQGNVCAGDCVDAADCDDGDACNGAETCVDGSCVSGTAVDCDDGDNCTDDLCDSATGDCSNDDVVCADGFACEDATGDCVEVTPCTTDADCVDELFCNGNETCLDSVCTDGTPPCADGETCDEDTQACGGDISAFILTEAVDVFTGGAGNDTFFGVVQAGSSTLSAGDQLNGGAGTDELNVIIVDADYAPIANIQNIEQIFVQNADTVNTRSFNAVGITGVEELWSNNSLNAVTLSSMESNAAVGIMGNSKNLTATFADSVLQGTNDTVTVNLSNSTATVGATIVVGSTTGGSAPTDGGPETILVNSVGSSNRIASIDDNGENDFTTLSLAGDQAVRIDAIGSSVTTIDGSAATGALDVTTDNADANALTVIGGAGDDTFRSSVLSSTDSVDGGAGSDTVILTGTFGGTLTNVEAMEVTNTGAVVSLDLNNAQDITSLQINNSGALTTLTLTNLPPGPTVTVDTDTNVVISVASTITLKTDTGGSDALTLGFAGNGSVTVNTFGIATGNLETLTINANGGLVTFDVVDSLDQGNADTLQTITITGSAGVTVSTGALANSASLTKLDASTLTGALMQNVAANDGTTAITITSGSGNDTLTGGTGNDTLTSGGGNDTITAAGGNDTISAGDGNDIVVGGAGVDTITGGNGNDTITGAAGVDAITGGAGSDTFRVSIASASGADANTISDFDDTPTTGDVLNFNAAVATLTGTDNFGSSASLQTHSATGALAVAAATEVVVVTVTTVTNFTDAGSLDGTNLITAIGGAITGFIVGQNDILLCVADGSGNVGVYHASSADAAIINTEITLIAVLQGSDVALANLVFQNFGNT